jgi:hypothetical protein
MVRAVAEASGIKTRIQTRIGEGCTQRTMRGVVAVLASQPRDSAGRRPHQVVHDTETIVDQSGAPAPLARFSLKAEDNLRVLEHVPPPTLRRRQTWWTRIVTLVRSAGKTIAR